LEHARAHVRLGWLIENAFILHILMSSSTLKQQNRK